MRMKPFLLLIVVAVLTLAMGAVQAGAAEKGKEAKKGPKAIATDKAPAAIGPYSQGVMAGNVIYVSGQLPINPATNSMPADVAEQAKQSMANIKAVLEAADSGMDKVVMVNIFMQDLNQFKVVNDVYATFFTGNFPARATVQVARLPRDAMVEISAIAVK